jgi:hypothetical protein
MIKYLAYDLNHCFGSEDLIPSFGFHFHYRVTCSWLKLSIQFRQNNNHKQQELKDQNTSKIKSSELSSLHLDP